MEMEETAEKIIKEILGKGLKDSTWRDNYPEAYTELLIYRKDLVLSVLKILKI